MAYIYQADVWCDSCGEHIKAELDRENKTPEDVDDESSFDSDEYPKHYDAESEESDGPENCADGRCGGFSNGSSYGTFLQNQLTQEGYRYLKGMLDGHGATLPEYAKEWADYYQFEYHAQEFTTAHEWLASKSNDAYLLAVIDKLDADTIQDLFEREMAADGFFKESGWYSSEMTNNMNFGI
jgi:hypothetical protein